MKFARTALVIAGAVFLGALTTVSVTAEDLQLPNAPGKEQVTESCMQCHGVDLILARPRSPDEWSQVVSQMIGYGATMTDDQYNMVVTYLSKNLSGSVAPSAAKPAPPAQ